MSDIFSESITEWLTALNRKNQQRQISNPTKSNQNATQNNSRNETTQDIDSSIPSQTINNNQQIPLQIQQIQPQQLLINTENPLKQDITLAIASLLPPIKRNTLFLKNPNTNNRMEKENIRNSQQLGQYKPRHSSQLTERTPKQNKLILPSPVSRQSKIVQLKPLNNQDQQIVRHMQFKPWSGQLSIQTISDNEYYFKFLKEGGFVKIIKGLLEENGFKETEGEDWTIIWSCGVIPATFYETMLAYQKVNHYPGMSGITRKDKLSMNITRMQTKHGQPCYSFLPSSFILPSQASEFLEDADSYEDKWYILKPSAGSKGQGIFLSNKPTDIIDKQKQSESKMVVSRYIVNPMLIDGLKFDLRIYVLITSIDPLKIFLYDEGLVRFASQPYNTPTSHDLFQLAHLTNYSLNKAAPNFIPNKDAYTEAKGNKWSLLAFKDFLKLNGVNPVKIMGDIEDIIIKTILSIEPQLHSAFQGYVPYRNNCFELLGFDILVDANLKTWLLEVNLSPSLGTDSPLDLKIKGQLIADIFSLIGIVPNEQRYSVDQSHSYNRLCQPNQTSITSQLQRMRDWQKAKQRLSLQEKHVLKEAEEELSRARHFKRIYPTNDSHKYKSFFPVERPLNLLLSNMLRDQYSDYCQSQGNTCIRSRIKTTDSYYPSYQRNERQEQTTSANPKQQSSHSQQSYSSCSDTVETKNQPKTAQVQQIFPQVRQINKTNIL